MIPALIAGLEVAAEYLATVEASTESLSFVRTSLTAMRWGDSSLASIQFFNALNTAKPVAIDYQPGESFYLSLLGGYLGCASGLLKAYGPTFHRVLEDSIIVATAHSYSSVSAIHTRTLVSTFTHELGRQLQSSDFDCIPILGHTLESHPIQVKPFEPLYDYINNQHLKFSDSDEVESQFHGMQSHELRRIYQAMATGINVDRIVDVLEGLTPDKNGGVKVNALSSSLLKSSSLLGILYQGMISGSVEETTMITPMRGTGSPVISTRGIFNAPVAYVNDDPLFPDVIVTRELISRASMMATMRQGYSYDTELKQLVKTANSSNPVTSTSMNKAPEQLIDQDAVSSHINSLLKLGGMTIAKKAATHGAELLANYIKSKT